MGDERKAVVQQCGEAKAAGEPIQQQKGEEVRKERGESSRAPGLDGDGTERTAGTASRP